MQISLPDSDFIFFGYIYTEMRQLDHTVILYFLFLVVLFLIFWGTSIQFPIMGISIYIATNGIQRFTFSPYPYQYLLSFDTLIIIVLTGMRWYLIMIFICISLQISEVKHLFIHLLATCMSSLEKCLFKSFVIFRSFFFFCFGGFFFCY